MTSTPFEVTKSSVSFFVSLKMPTYWLLPLSIFCAVGCFSAQTWLRAQDNRTQFAAIRGAEGVTIVEGIRPVLTFQQEVRTSDGKWPRSNYVHPLYDLDGDVLTEDFPVDHGHHRGIFWAWHQVLVDGKQIGDAWLCEDFEWDVQNVSVSKDHGKAVIATSTFWKSPHLLNDAGEAVPFVQEHVIITVHPSESNVRSVDFEIALLALVDKVMIGGSNDEKGYGGFSPRIKLSEATRFTGTMGDVVPENLAVQAGPCVDISNSKTGLAILTHPMNPGFPQSWILRKAKSMQNPVYPGRIAVQLSQSEPLVLRYRLLIHRGGLDKSALAAYQSQYADSE